MRRGTSRFVRAHAGNLAHVIIAAVYVGRFDGRPGLDPCHRGRQSHGVLLGGHAAGRSMFSFDITNLPNGSTLIVSIEHKNEKDTTWTTPVRSHVRTGDKSAVLAAPMRKHR